MESDIQWLQFCGKWLLLEQQQWKDPRSASLSILSSHSSEQQEGLLYLRMDSGTHSLKRHRDVSKSSRSYSRRWTGSAVGIHHTHFLTFGELSCIGWYKITSLLMPPECCSANSALQAQDYNFILVTVMRFFPETPEKRNIFQSVRKGLRPTMLTLVHAFSDGVKPMHQRNLHVVMLCAMAVNRNVKAGVLLIQSALMSITTSTQTSVYKKIVPNIHPQ